jgi:hypothetical protein
MRQIAASVAWQNAFEFYWFSSRHPPFDYTHEQSLQAAHPIRYKIERYQ